MEDILIDLMTMKCHKMYEDSKCKKKGKCDGSCPYFLSALMELSKKNS